MSSRTTAAAAAPPALDRSDQGRERLALRRCGDRLERRWRPPVVIEAARRAASAALVAARTDRRDGRAACRARAAAGASGRCRRCAPAASITGWSGAIAVVGRALIAQRSRGGDSPAARSSAGRAVTCRCRARRRSAPRGPRRRAPAPSGSSSRANSCSRPTSGAGPERSASKRLSAMALAAARARRASAREALDALGPRSAIVEQPPTSARVAAPITMLPGVGQRLQARREVGRLARPPPALGLRPAPIRSPATTSPLRCRCGPPSGSPARRQCGRPHRPIASPARIARSASSSCACG